MSFRDEKILMIVVLLGMEWIGRESLEFQGRVLSRGVACRIDSFHIEYCRCVMCCGVQ